MMVKADMAFKDGQLVRIPGGFPFKLIRAGNIARTEYAVQAGEHFGHDDYTIMQVLLPDKKGRFPGDDGCREPYSQVPVLRLE